MSDSSIWLINKTFPGATTPGQSGPGRDVNEGVLRIPQRPSITGALPSDCLMSYPRHSLEESYPSSEIQSVYSTTPADRAGFSYLHLSAKYKLYLLLLKDLPSIHNVNND